MLPTANSTAFKKSLVLRQLTCATALADCEASSRHLRCLAHMRRHFAPALVLSLLDPKLSWDEADVQASVQRGLEVVKADGSPLSPYDLKRLQACSASP